MTLLTICYVSLPPLSLFLFGASLHLTSDSLWYFILLAFFHPFIPCPTFFFSCKRLYSIAKFLHSYGVFFQDYPDSISYSSPQLYLYSHLHTTRGEDGEAPIFYAAKIFLSLSFAPNGSWLQEYWLPSSAVSSYIFAHHCCLHIRMWSNVTSLYIIVWFVKTFFFFARSTDVEEIENLLLHNLPSLCCPLSDWPSLLYENPGPQLSEHSGPRSTQYCLVVILHLAFQQGDR